MGCSVAVIGAGPMGLMCAYRLLKAGHKVDVFEQDDRIGGMSASFDFEGTPIERYYHFICKGDFPLFHSLAELGLSDKLRWRETRMGFYYKGKLYRWGNPLYLLAFTSVSLYARMRYAFHILHCKRQKDFTALDEREASAWLKECLGKKAYNVFWEPLLRLKYFEFSGHISAAWVAARIRRVAQSRKNLWAEELGYLEGGSATYLNRLAEEIQKMGGTIYLSTPVKHIGFENGSIASLHTEQGDLTYDAVASTIALPLLAKIAGDMPADELSRIWGIQNIAVVCVVLKMTEPYSENFWTNINQQGIDIPGIVEYTNLAPLADPILYIPYYLPPTHPRFRYTDEQFVEEALRYLTELKPEFNRNKVKAIKVNRCRYAQTVCTPHFLKALPPMTSRAKGFFLADTSYYYPEDRSISESISTADTLANCVDQYLKKTYAA